MNEQRKFPFVGFIPTYGVLSIIGSFIFSITSSMRKWLVPFLFSPGIAGFAVFLMAYRINDATSQSYDSLGSITGATMIVCAVVELIFCIVKLEPAYWQQELAEPRIMMMIEEFCVFWIFIGSLLVSYTGSDTGLGQKLIFVLIIILVGVIEAIIGFTNKTSWRRIQGLLLITIAIIAAAFIGDSSIARPVLLILGAIMIIIIIVMQMYWSNLFQQMCGSSKSQIELQEVNK